MAIRRVQKGVMRLSVWHELDDSYGTSEIDGKLAKLESVLHELAHGFALCGRVLTTARVAARIERQSATASHWQEFVTLRLEVEVLTRLGIEVNGRALFQGADASHSYDCAAFEAPLTRGEQLLVYGMMETIRSAMLGDSRP